MDKIPVRNISSSLKEPDLSGTFSIRKLDALLSGQDMVQELHRHSFFYVLILEKGTGEHSIDFVPYPVSDHAVFFMRPGQVHQLMLKHDSTGYLMSFTNDFYAPLKRSASEVLRKVSNKNHYLPDAEQFKKLLSILSGIFQEYSDKQEGYLDVIQSSLDIFLIALMRQSRNPESPSNSGNEYMQERLEELQTLIALHISAQKQVAYYANKLHITPYQLNAITKTTLGKTCSEVINDYILLEAKRYLLATPNQVNQIAWHLGYDDVSYFIRFFKKHTGSSPDTFRKNFR